MRKNREKKIEKSLGGMNSFWPAHSTSPWPNCTQHLDCGWGALSVSPRPTHLLQGAVSRACYLIPLHAGLACQIRPFL
jgi:hypothetical protein